MAAPNTTKRSGVPLLRCLNSPCRNKIVGVDSNEYILSCHRPACQAIVARLPEYSKQKIIAEYHAAISTYETRTEAARQDIKNASEDLKYIIKTLAKELHEARTDAVPPGNMQESRVVPQ
jgi:hypothetical protein